MKTTPEKLKKEIKELIGANDTGKALKILLDKELPAIEKELILINSRYSKVSEEQRMGISDEDDIQRNLNKINFDLLALVELIGTKPVAAITPTATSTNSSGSKSNIKKYLLYGCGLLLALMLGWHLMDDHAPTPTPTTKDTKATSSKETTKSALATSASTAPPKTAPPTQNTSPSTPDQTKVNKVSNAAPTKVTPSKPDDPNMIYKVGVEYGGGKIFYVDESGKHGLIMSPIDVSKDPVYWLNNDGPVAKAGATSLGNGQLNTQDLIDKFGEGDYPAQLCAKYSRRGFTDWYLPSKTELEKLYDYSLTHPKELDNNSYYWSSTEIPDSKKDVYYKNFRTGETYMRLPKYNDYKKQNKARVRAIRSF